jgi:hypothetical protein
VSLQENLAAALRNLSRKKAGEDVDWINIADARALTELGLAERTPSGWSISTAGEAVIKDIPQTGPVVRLIR